MSTLPADDRVRLRQVLDAARKAQAWAAEHDRQHPVNDEQFSLALQRLIEIIGEAAKRVSFETREQAERIAWPESAGMRDRLIHGYFDVNLDILWDTVTDDLPPLAAALEVLLQTDEPGFKR